MTTDRPLILAIGDSLIAGYGLQAVDSFPARLQASLQTARPGARVVNTGVSGDTTADVLRRLPRLLSALERCPAADPGGAYAGEPRADPAEPG
jgi:acyl-CoA thioesterase-1